MASRNHRWRRVRQSDPEEWPGDSVERGIQALARRKVARRPLDQTWTRWAAWARRLPGQGWPADHSALGGVTSTAGGAVGAVTNTAANVGGTAGGAVNSAANAGGSNACFKGSSRRFEWRGSAHFEQPRRVCLNGLNLSAAASNATQGRWSLPPGRTCTLTVARGCCWFRRQRLPRHQNSKTGPIVC